MTQPNTPSDPEANLAFHMYQSSALTLTSIYDLLSELQTFWIEQKWPVGSPEYNAVADTLESVKRMVAVSQNNMVAKSHKLLE